MMLLNGGELEGVRVLRPETVDLMWRNGLDKAQLPLSLNGWTSDGNTGRQRCLLLPASQSRQGVAILL